MTLSAGVLWGGSRKKNYGQTGENPFSAFEVFQSSRFISIKTLGGGKRKEIFQELNLKSIMGQFWKIKRFIVSKDSQVVTTLEHFNISTIDSYSYQVIEH